jgi:hypothetical protein
MRTTVNIDDHLLMKAKKIAVSSNSTLSSLVETALKEMLNRRSPTPKKKKIKLVTYRGRGLRHGVDLDDSAALLDLMEKA